MQEIIDKIKELRKLANETDSKKKDLEYRIEIKKLSRQLENYFDEQIRNFPDTVDITIKLNKTISYDTSNFKDWLMDYLEDNGYDIPDFNIKEQLEDYLEENFYVEDHIYNDAYEINIDGLE